VKIVVLIVVSCIAISLAACGSDNADETTRGSSAESQPASESSKPVAEPDQPPDVSIPPGPPPKKLVVKDLEVGSGPAVKLYSQVTLVYVAVDYESGEPLQVQWDRSSPFVLDLEPKREVEAFEKGLIGMKAGGQRELIAPSRLAYGDGALVYRVDMLAVK